MLIKFEKDTTQEQREKVLVSYYEEHMRDVERAHNNPLWMEIRGFAKTLKPEILAQQRRDIVGQKTKSLKT